MTVSERRGDPAWPPALRLRQVRSFPSSPAIWLNGQQLHSLPFKFIRISMTFRSKWSLSEVSTSSVKMEVGDTRNNRSKLCDASSLDPTIWFEMLEASASPVHPARVEMVDYPEKRSALRTRDRQ